MKTLFAVLSLLAFAATAPALAEEPLRLPGGLTIGGAAADTQVQIFHLNNVSGGVSPSPSHPAANLTWKSGDSTTVELGAALSRERFSVSTAPGNPLNVTRIDRPADQQFTLRIDHALSETMQLGAAAATQRLSTGPEGGNAQTNYVIGARLGVRF